jgi:hypothetical protein
MLASFRMAATIAVFARYRENTQIPVGAELARDNGVSANIDVECDTAIASKLSSYRIACSQPNLRQKKARSR